MHQAEGPKFEARLIAISMFGKGALVWEVVGCLFLVVWVGEPACEPVP